MLVPRLNADLLQARFAYQSRRELAEACLLRMDVYSGGSYQMGILLFLQLDRLSAFLGPHDMPNHRMRCAHLRCKGEQQCIANSFAADAKTLHAQIWIQHKLSNMHAQSVIKSSLWSSTAKLQRSAAHTSRRLLTSSSAWTFLPRRR